MNMEAAAPLPEEPIHARPVDRGAWEMWMVVLVGVLIIGIGLLFILMPKEADVVPVASERDALSLEMVAVKKLEDEAREVLRGLLSARTLAEKERYLLGSGLFRSEVGFPEAFEEDLSEQLFAVSPYYTELRERGIFVMLYERPAAASIENYPRPILRTEVQLRLEEPTWLEIAEDTEFIERAQRPIRVMAFFKREDGRLLLDWDLWKQSGSRSLEEFSFKPDSPAATFRVKIGAMHPGVAAVFGETEGAWFWIEGACYGDLRYAVEAPREVAQMILESTSPTMFVPEEPPSLAATVELEWDREKETMRIGRFVCWGFEGLME